MRRAVITKSTVASVAAVSLLGAMVANQTSTARAAEADDCSEVESAVGNIIYDAENCGGDYTPDIAAADAESQQMALNIFIGALEFCIDTPTLADAKAKGYDSNDGSHWFHSEGTQPETIEDLYDIPLPATAMVESPYDDDGSRIAGYMVYQYEGFPYIGKIPRTHRHTKDGNPQDEMYHTYCKTSMEEAFKYRESNASNTPSVAELRATLDAALTGGVAAVSDAKDSAVMASGSTATAPRSTAASPITGRATTSATPGNRRAPATAALSQKRGRIIDGVAARGSSQQNRADGTAGEDGSRPVGYSKFVENNGIWPRGVESR